MILIAVNVPFAWKTLKKEIESKSYLVSMYFTSVAQKVGLSTFVASVPSADKEFLSRREK